MTKIIVTGSRLDWSTARIRGCSMHRPGKTVCIYRTESDVIRCFFGLSFIPWKHGRNWRWHGFGLAFIPILEVELVQSVPGAESK